MKTKFRRYGKRTVSALLSLMMVVSCLMLGQIVSVEANAATVTIGANEKMYLYFDSSAISGFNWEAEGAETWFYFWNSNDTSENSWVQAANTSNSHCYRVTVPTGTYTKYTVNRVAPGSNHATDDSIWNYTYDCDMPSSETTTDLIQPTSVNYKLVGDWSIHNHYTWHLSDNPTATIAPNSVETAKGGTVSFTSGMETTMDDVFVTHSLSVTPDTGVTISKTSDTVSAVTFDTPGDYTVTTTVTYHAPGLTGVTGTAETTAPVTVHNTVTGLNVQYQSSGEATTNADIASMSYTVNDTTTSGVTTNGETGIDSAALTAAATDENGWYFSHWEATSGAGSFGDIYSRTTTFIPSGNNVTVTAVYKPAYNVTFSAASGSGSVNNTTVSSTAGSGKIVPGGKATFHYTKNGNTSVTAFIIKQGGTQKGESVTATGTTTAFYPDASINGDVTLEYTTINVETVELSAYIANPYGDAGSMKISYTNRLGEQTETAWTTGYFAVEAQKGTSASVTVKDTVTVNNDIIIDKFKLSGSYADASNLTAERQADTPLETFTVTFTANGNVTTEAYFKEDEGVAYGDYSVVFGSEANFNNWNKYSPVYRTYNDCYYAYINKSDLSSVLYFGLSDNSNHTLKKYDSKVTVEADSSLAPYLEPVADDTQWDYYHLGGVTVKNTSIDRIKLQIGNEKNGGWFKLFADLSNISDVADGRAKVIAKDGTIRGNYVKYALLADTKITSFISGGNYYTNRENNYLRTENGSETEYPIIITEFDGYAETASLPQGSTVTFTTELNAEAGNTYKVEAWNVNGETVFPTSVSGNIYTGSYTIPADETYVEITPIYYYKDDSNSITFYVENFEEAKTAWGEDTRTVDNKTINTHAVLSCYAWYSLDQGSDLREDRKPALGGYPGQPMVYTNGHYEMQVPKSITHSDGVVSSVNGITMNNYVWDTVHSYTMGATEDEDREKINCQTNDYDDFVALEKLIVNEPSKYNNAIIFRFKYRDQENAPAVNNGSADAETRKQNRLKGNTPEEYDQLSNGSYSNGWEDYKDYNEKYIDLFNNILYGESEQPYHIVSDSFNDVYYGHFGVMWYIYAPDGKRIGCLPSSAFYFKATAENMASDTIPEDFVPNAAGSDWIGTGSDREYFWSIYKALYNGGEHNVPEGGAQNVSVKITYETAIYGQDQDGNGHPRDPGLRNDGRWFYSKRDVEINASIRIDYKPHGFDTYKVDENRNTTGHYKGKVTHAEAYFTAPDSDSQHYMTSTVVDKFSGMVTNPTEDAMFEFKAPLEVYGIDGVKYRFDGWYIEKDGVQSIIPSERDKPNEHDLEKVSMLASTEVLGETVLIVKYSPDDTHYLTVTHIPYTYDTTYAREYTYTGDASSKPKWIVKDSGGSGETEVVLSIVDKNKTVMTKGKNDYEQEVVLDLEKSQDTFKTYDKETLYYAYKQDSESMIKIVLNSIPEKNNAVKTLYRQVVADGVVSGVVDPYVSHYGDTDFNTYPFNKDNESTLGEPLDLEIKALENADSETTVAGSTSQTTVTYYVKIADLFDDITDQTKRNLKAYYLRYYTDFAPRELNVQFKYYDRAVQNGQAENISTTPTTITISDVPYTNTLSETIAKALSMKGVVNGGNGNTGNCCVNDISNVLCDYTFWTSQEAAKSNDGGFPTFTNFHSNTHSDKYTANNAGYTKHTDPYGYMQSESGCLESAKDDQEWVSYYTSSNVNDLSDKITEADAKADTTAVNTIVVWGYNEPKKYNIIFKKPLNETELTQIGDTNLYKPVDEGDLTTLSLYGQLYYNERIGNYSDEQSPYSLVSPYLAKTFNNPSPTNGRFSSVMNEGNNEALGKIDQSLNLDDPLVTPYSFIFDGWYNGDVKVSSDRMYDNRVTTDITLEARYKKVEITGTPEDEHVGFSVSANDTEEYIDENGNAHVRYVMMLNTYGTHDSDENIKKIAFISILLPATDGETGAPQITDEQMQQAIADLKQNETFKNAIATVTGTDGKNGAATTEPIKVNDLDCYVVAKVYDAAVQKIVDGNLITTDPNASVILTNKNRTQYVLVFDADKVVEGGSRSDIVMLTAVGYDGVDEGDTVSAGEFIFSDNFVRFINGSEGSYDGTMPTED